ncbi:nitric oxide reductase NorD protein [Bradyrhizobium barranii subsp. barranii]|uniref:nitric oxide reductase activation protein NorD n=1 Tax=Bradyrhizobium TaxID=374 RepID=UPI000420973F|nr:MULTISPECIES: VWA domain-containing protein [Bradyrhizobium]MBR0877522.1 VWA domain-containing protein [Bradyrhizobium liaoningense]MBR1002841.1 VWA domain-containing protein [Bradyrhizobium liaoningense]MBR1063664.1 VWA domain-containing protein [Bradyrhizobium liaoningense]MCP1739811.1 nitric oxide reductase NorD protein [Bradyrhizobium japonicum]MCP1777994.1 nitric oxide reductase NorD protein [Bradyrhizobium japonicum]
MLDFLELEETVGRAWHRLVGGTASYPAHAEHAVSLAEVRSRIAIMFRALGGETGVQIASASARRTGHRLGWRQRIGLGDERLGQPGRDAATIFLPNNIAIFADRGLNAALYRWLAAWFAFAPVDAIAEADPLRRDLLTLRQASEVAVLVLTECPGLAEHYARLAAATAMARPHRPLPRVEQDMEQIVLALLGADTPPVGKLWPAMMGTGPLPDRAPPGYRSILPCPLWGDCWTRALSPTHEGDDEWAPTAAPAPSDDRKRFAVREREDGTNRRDPFVLNRFEKILAMAEMINVDRPADDSEDEDAQKAADDLEEITLSRRSSKPASRLKFDLDLPPEALDLSPLNADLSYPEWDYRSGSYLPDHCRVLAGAASELGEGWTPDDAMRRHIRQVRRRFEVLRPRRELMRAQADGHDLDLDALVRARCDLRAGSGGGGLDRVHVAMRPRGDDLAVTLLVDVSLSTDAWVDGYRVLDVEKEALLVLAHGLSACGDHHSILTFTSRRRSWVRLETVKAFGEPMSGAIERRIGALKPGYYTRIGAAVRHASAQLARQPQRKKLLLVLTDGKPNDVDHYEGRFAVEDTRKSVQEVRRLGIAVFGVTVDATAQSYVPTLFGRSGYAIVGNIRRLPAALPAIYRQVAH